VNNINKAVMDGLIVEGRDGWGDGEKN